MDDGTYLPFRCAVGVKTMLSNSEMSAQASCRRHTGSLVGFQRERLLWAAGIRTHMLVCVGSCLIMIVSAFGFADVLSKEHVVLDPSRVAAQVVSGIGFLGAGSILARGEIVKRTDHRGKIWAVAAIGLAVGGGLYLLPRGRPPSSSFLILGGGRLKEEAYRSRNQTKQLMAEVGIMEA